jgi:hypothetical protein
MADAGQGWPLNFFRHHCLSLPSDSDVARRILTALVNSAASHSVQLITPGIRVPLFSAAASLLHHHETADRRNLQSAQFRMAGSTESTRFSPSRVQSLAVSTLIS